MAYLLRRLFGLRIPPDVFERSVFRIVLRRLSDAGPVKKEVEAISKLNAIPDKARRENAAAHHYLAIEEHIQNGQERGRVSRETLRGSVYDHCYPEYADGAFALLFLTKYTREIRLFERFVDALIIRARPLVGDDGYAAIRRAADELPGLRSIVNEQGFRADLFERGLRQLGPAEQVRQTEVVLKNLVDLVVKRLFAVLDTVRTELALQDSYRDLQTNLDFLEDVPAVLRIVPEELLTEERIGLLGKSELAHELQRKSQEFEMSIAELQAEKEKLSNLSREELEKRVTERTAELAAALEEAHERRAELEEFSSLATHELRTPIGIIKGYTSLLLDGSMGDLTKEQKRFIKQIKDTNQRLLELVNAMLNASRIELGTLAIEPEPVFLPDLAEQVVGDLRPQAEVGGLELRTKFDRKLPIANLDPNLMRAIMQNLVSNSVKYTPKGGWVEIEIEKREPDILITVRDTGYGIPEKDQGKVFSKMFRADNVRSLKVEGTGLGLYIVRSVLEQAGGKIWFESPPSAEATEGKPPSDAEDKEHPGTAFYVSIPLSGMKKKEGIKGLS